MAKTIHLDGAKALDIAAAADLLRGGGLVAFATETVYGLGANALSAEAVAKIFEAKQRPSWDPLIVHLALAEQLRMVATVPEGLAERVNALALAFWPGPLTLLLPRSAAVPDAVTAGRALVGVRVPAHPVALALLTKVNLPIAAPSANLFGHTSPTTAEHVFADLDGRIDAVLDAGPTMIGVESTVIDPTQTPMVLYRPGAISIEQLMAATGVAVEVFVPVAEASDRREALPSPGVGIRHYAPRATLKLAGGSQEALRSAVGELLAEGSGLRIGVLLPEGWSIDGRVVVHRWGQWDDPAELAAGLFSGLRALDDHGVAVILCPLPPAGGLGDAMRDRLEKAARAK